MSAASKVSIIVPVYNAEKYLDRCIQSLNDQSYPNIEVIMVNDGSTDKSLDRIVDQARHQNNFIALDQHNQGPAIARRTGLMQASGKYVMFIDSDDTLEQDAVEFLVEKLESEDLDTVYANFNRVNGAVKSPIHDRDFEGIVSPRQMLKFLLTPSFQYVACMCFSKRELWENRMFVENRELPSEDILTNVMLVLKCNRVGVYNKRIYNYYQVETSLTMTGKYFTQALWHDYFEMLTKILDENGVLAMFADDIKINTIHTFGFYIKDVDTADEWYKHMMSYDVKHYPRKIRVLHELLNWPWMLQLCVKCNRMLKRCKECLN